MHRKKRKEKYCYVCKVWDKLLNISRYNENKILPWSRYVVQYLPSFPTSSCRYLCRYISECRDWKVSWKNRYRMLSPRSRMRPDRSRILRFGQAKPIAENRGVPSLSQKLVTKSLLSTISVNFSNFENRQEVGEKRSVRAYMACWAFGRYPSFVVPGQSHEETTTWSGSHMLVYHDQVGPRYFMKSR